MSAFLIDVIIFFRNESYFKYSNVWKKKVCGGRSVRHVFWADSFAIDLHSSYTTCIYMAAAR